MRKKSIISYLLTIVSFLLVLFLGNKTVSTVAPYIPSQRKLCIILDAGHGGEDGGAVSCTGISESLINLEITIKLRDFLHLLGYQTKMIRTEDVSVYTSGSTISQRKVSDLKERVRIINESDRGLLLSIHQNSFADSKYKGAQVFYSNTGNSAKLAELVQKAFADTINPGSRRQCKRGDGIFILEKISNPGILIECGFITHPEEERLLRNPEYQKKIACVIGCALSSFLSNT